MYIRTITKNTDHKELYFQQWFVIINLYLLPIICLTLSCQQKQVENTSKTLHLIEFIDFENPRAISPIWQKKGNVQLVSENNTYLKILGNKQNTSEWHASISLDSTWRRVRISGKVKIPYLTPQPQFGKTARLFTAFYSTKGDILSFSGDINFTHLTWRNPFNQWEYFEHSFNLPKYLDNRKDSKGNNIMDIRFQVREAEGALLLDDITIEVIPEKYEMTGQEFQDKVLPYIKAEDKIGATIAESQINEISQIIYVDSRNKIASDENDGSKNAPFLTFKKALTSAIASNQPARIVLHEGEYMEENQIVMEGDLEGQPLLVIEGQGDVRITGAKKLTNWNKKLHNRLYSKVLFGFITN